MRERVLQAGYDDFADHEILEMFLYATNARGDTNETAHRLIEHFGSFGAVMEADVEELTEVSGVGRQSAFQISLGMELVRRCARSRTVKATSYTSVRQIAEYIWNYLFGLDHERLYLMLFDNRMELISHVRLSDGTVNSTAVPKRELMEIVLRKHASSVVLAHNHPHGEAQASEEDIRVTTEIAELLRMIGVTLREHLVITDDRFQSIMKNHYRFPHVMADSAQVSEDGFDWNAFYDVDEETYRFPMLKTLSE